jgi:nicotinate phosphoribosyltransferase
MTFCSSWKNYVSLETFGRCRKASCFSKTSPFWKSLPPIIEAQLVETFIINQINLQSLIATKAARCVHAAGKRAVVDFALRRTMESMPG